MSQSTLPVNWKFTYAVALAHFTRSASISRDVHKETHNSTGYLYLCKHVQGECSTVDYVSVSQIEMQSYFKCTRIIWTLDWDWASACRGKSMHKARIRKLEVVRWGYGFCHSQSSKYVHTNFRNVRQRIHVSQAVFFCKSAVQDALQLCTDRKSVV